MKASKIMSKNLITLRQSDTMKKAIKTLSKNSISGCPVVSKGRLVGIVTETDIVDMIDIHSKVQKDDNLLPLVLSVIKSKRYEKMNRVMKKVLYTKVKEFMKKEVVTINADDDIYTIAKMMGTHDVDRLPVVKNEKLVGILTRADIIKTMEKLGE
jgi:CBS domain-containing protein